MLDYGLWWDQNENLFISIFTFDCLLISGIFQAEKAKMRKAASSSKKPNHEVADFGRELADSPLEEENTTQGIYI